MKNLCKSSWGPFLDHWLLTSDPAAIPLLFKYSLILSFSASVYAHRTWEDFDRMANLLQLFASKLFFRPRLKACNNRENVWSGCKVEMTKKRAETFKWLQRITSLTTVLEINSWGQDFSLQLTPNGKSFCRSLKERHTIQNSGQLNNGRKTLLVQLLTLKPQQKYKAPNSSSCVCLYFTRTLKLCYIPSIIFLILEDLYFSNVTAPV